MKILPKEGLSGVATGFEKLDALTSGWQPSDLIIIAARPGMGKTALTLSMARNIAVMKQTPVAFFFGDVFSAINHPLNFSRNWVIL